ncbi:MAG: hypothetical protein GF353_24705 [Candidatus Lokiarchaeota archaeon]|nr:hypothetical protein [Candidatus Lokiarchaeota archaeon]
MIISAKIPAYCIDFNKEIPGQSDQYSLKLQVDTELQFQLALRICDYKNTINKIFKELTPEETEDIVQIGIQFGIWLLQSYSDSNKSPYERPLSIKDILIRLGWEKNISKDIFLVIIMLFYALKTISIYNFELCFQEIEAIIAFSYKIKKDLVNDILNRLYLHLPELREIKDFRVLAQFK